MQHLPEIKVRGVSFFSELFAHSLAGLPAALTERIGASETDRQRNRYLDARNALEAASVRVMRDYEAALAAAFDVFAEGAEGAGPALQRQQSLSLIDKASYEDDVAARASAARVAAENAEALWKLNRRLAVVRGGRKFADEANPCGPWQLCRAAQLAFRPLPVDAQCRRYFYQVYALDVLSRAGEFYGAINDELARRGILANLGFDLVNQACAAGAGRAGAPARARAGEGAARAAGEVARARAANDPPDEADAAADIVPELERRQARVMEAIRAAQRQRAAAKSRACTAAGVHYGALSSDGVAGQADTFSAAEIAAALDELQDGLRCTVAEGAAPGTVSAVQGRLFGALGERGGSDRRARITALDADTIDLVGMLFEVMLDDPQLPDRLKSLLSYLHTPYLKVALSDPTFFASVKHPARRLLDLLADTGARWLQSGEDDDRVWQRIRQVVEHIIGEFRDDLQVFDDQRDQFERFVQVLEKRASLAERRSQETQRGLDKLAGAKSLVMQELRRRTAEVALADAVAEVLLEPWADYLVYICLRHGAGGDAWRAALGVVDEVVALARGETTVEGPTLASVQEQLAQGLQLAGCDRPRSDRLLRALGESLREVPAGRVGDAGAVAPRAGRRLSAIGRQMQRQDESARESAGLSCQQQALAARLAEVEFGTWFEFRQEGGKPRQRLKLSWYSSISGNYLFVNSAGVKSALKSLREMVHGLHDGSIVMLDPDQGGFYERTVSAVLLRLKRR